MITKYATLIRFIIALFVIGFILYIFTWNISLRKRIHVDHEKYRSFVQDAIKECIEADSIDDVHIALRKVEVARTSIRKAAELVGGIDNLRFLSGLDVDRILSTMAYQQEQILTVTNQTNMLKSHPLNEFITQSPQDAVTKTPANFHQNQNGINEEGEDLG